MEMPIPEYQEEPAKSTRVPPGKEGLLKGPASKFRAKSRGHCANAAI